MNDRSRRAASAEAAEQAWVRAKSLALGTAGTNSAPCQKLKTYKARPAIRATAEECRGMAARNIADELRRGYESLAASYETLARDAEALYSRSQRLKSN